MFVSGALRAICPSVCNEVVFLERFPFPAPCGTQGALFVSVEQISGRLGAVVYDKTFPAVFPHPPLRLFECVLQYFNREYIVQTASGKKPPHQSDAHIVRRRGYITSARNQRIEHHKPRHAMCFLKFHGGCRRRPREAGHKIPVVAPISFFNQLATKQRAAFRQGKFGKVARNVQKPVGEVRNFAPAVDFCLAVAYNRRYVVPVALARENSSSGSCDIKYPLVLNAVLRFWRNKFFIERVKRKLYTSFSGQCLALLFLY